ncbi:transposase [Bacteroides fragilis]|uniref:IS66 family transposase n=1 Tax=Bacteroides fragilis TaxID=817 RepID=UPI0021CD3C8F|nr:transposase [Bacteroides fragilis]MCS2317450.1 transposase [Bacteroides fragilis]MCZ2647772.1 transposase [Bacteroides fragilis]
MEDFNVYRKDREYTIDNLVAEAIRPLASQRKNSLFFCSTKGALRLAIYNTFIEICK